jgi:hypothetical protein
MACIQLLKYTSVIHNRFDLPIIFPLALGSIHSKMAVGLQTLYIIYICGELFTTLNSFYRVRVDHLFTASFTSTALLYMTPTEIAFSLYSQATFSLGLTNSCEKL